MEVGNDFQLRKFIRYIGQQYWLTSVIALLAVGQIEGGCSVTDAELELVVCHASIIITAGEQLILK